MQQAADDARSGITPLYVAFPDDNAVDAAACNCYGTNSSNKHKCRPARQSSTQKQARYMLVVIDGTWQFAKEIFASAKQLLLPPHGHGIQIRIGALPMPACPNGGGIADARRHAACASSQSDIAISGCGTRQQSTCSRHPDGCCAAQLPPASSQARACGQDTGADCTFQTQAPHLSSTLALRSEPMVRHTSVHICTGCWCIQCCICQ